MFKTISYQYKPNKDLVKTIDLGINNLLTCVVSNNESFIIDGKYLKSINHFYNKKIAYLQSRKPNNKEYTKMESKVTNKRIRKIKDAINKTSKQVIKKEINESYTSIC